MRYSQFLFAPLEKPWANVVAKYTTFVAKHPWPFIVLPTLLTLVLSTGIFMDFKIVRGVKYLYSPLDAEWKAEEAVLVNNWASDDSHFYPGKDVTRRRGLYLIITAKDGGNILRQNHSEQVLQILDWVTNKNFTSSSGVNFSYRDVCLRFQNECFTNTHVKLIAKIFSNRHEQKLNISYPIYRSKFATEPMDLSKFLGNVVTDRNGIVRSASAWLLLYQLRQQGQTMDELSGNFENEVARSIEQGELNTSYLEVVYFHSNTFDQELAKENQRITPKFTITFTVLIIFAILCTVMLKRAPVPNSKRRSLTIDWVLSKPWMGVVGVVSTLMAIISSTGLLLLLGVQFVDMCTVMPFLSLTIGIDDTFLMLAAWHDSDRKKPWLERMEQTMRHAAVSISITSLTDALAFLIGAIAPLPAVMYFCYYSSAAICFIYIYCTTIFTAFLSLQARWEDDSRHCIIGAQTYNVHLQAPSWQIFFFNLGYVTQKVEEKDPNNNDGRNNSSATLTSEKEQDFRMWYQKYLEDYYAPFISKPIVSFGALLLLISYIVISVYGATLLVVGFDLINIVQENSLSRRFLEIRQQLFPEDMSILDIAVMNPPLLTNDADRVPFLRTMQMMENTFCSAGSDSTLFWLNAYKKYLDELGFGTNWDEIIKDNELFHSNLDSFLMANEKWSYDVKRAKNGSITAFRLSTRLRNVSSDENIYRCAQEFRSMCRKFSNLEMSTYSPLWNFADQYEIMWPQTMQDLYISIAVMVPVALLFIPQPLCAIAIALNIASIALGVIGSMPFLGVQLDATSMITIAMSVGFSVDFAAHVSYAYMTEKADVVPNECPAITRFRRTLGSVGWPVIQASLSVLLGVSSLAFVDSYVVQTCFKTVVLVICYGTAHALIFLPLCLMYVHKIYLYVLPASFRQ